MAAIARKQSMLRAGDRTRQCPEQKEKTVPKQKTHKGAAKRFKVTGGGKVTRHQAMHSHMLTSKTTKRKRHLRKSTEVGTAFAGTIKEMLHN
jgi:large subunit ribosomal protein L35